MSNIVEHYQTKFLDILVSHCTFNVKEFETWIVLEARRSRSACLTALRLRKSTSFTQSFHSLWPPFVPKEVCDKTKCPGPLRYYEAIGCTPVYANSGDCCAESYNCSHLDNLSRDKCYANGNEYSLGEKLKPEDANPCDIGCTCRSYRDV